MSEWVAVVSPYWRTFTRIRWQEIKNRIYIMSVRWLAPVGPHQILVVKIENFPTCFNQSDNCTNTRERTECGHKITSCYSATNVTKCNIKLELHSNVTNKEKIKWWCCRIQSKDPFDCKCLVTGRGTILWCQQNTKFFSLVPVLNLCWTSLKEHFMFQSNRRFNIPSPGIPRAFDAFVAHGGGEFDPYTYGMGNLNFCSIYVSRWLNEGW